MLSLSGSRGTSRAATVCVLVSRYVIGAPLLCVLQCGSDAHVKMRKFFIGIGNQTYRNNISLTIYQCNRCDLVSIAHYYYYYLLFSAHKSDLSYPWSQTQASLSIPSLHPKNKTKEEKERKKITDEKTSPDLIGGEGKK